MIVAIVSDIHSNHIALKSVLADARQQGATELWFLGDLVGYGPFPLQAWRQLRDARPPCRWALAGNHDWGLIGKLGGSFALEMTTTRGAESRLTHINLNHIAMRALELNADAIPNSGEGARVRAWLREQPLVVSPHPGIYLAHGVFDMKKPWAYLTNEEMAEASLRALLDWLAMGTPSGDDFVAVDGWQQPQLLIVGHWHRQLAWHREPTPDGRSAAWRRLIPGFGERPSDAAEPAASMAVLNDLAAPHVIEVASTDLVLTDDLDRVVVMNPGSVGIPRDGARAAVGWTWAKYALLDCTEAGARLRFRHVPYENADLLAALDSYPPEITGWLTRG